MLCVLFRGSLLAQMLISNISSTPAACSSNGTVTVTVTGGTPVYCYQINGGPCLYATDATFTFTDLTPGIKNISITDGLNTATVTATIEVQGNYQVPALFGLPRGCGVYGQASGGLPPYQYVISLSGGPFSPLQSDPQFTPVAGNYCLRVYDACNNFTEYCGFIDISPVEFTATCCEVQSSPNEICVQFTDRQGLHANDPGYWFGGQPPYTYSATATGLTINSPDGAFQLQQLCPGWSFTITDACGNMATQVPNCMRTTVQCIDCGAGTAAISTANGVAPYVYYYQDAMGQWQPNPAGGTIGSFTGLPVYAAGDTYIFQAIDACGNTSPPLPVQCLDAKGAYDCAVQTAYIEPLTDFFPANITCQTCVGAPVVFLSQSGLATFPAIPTGSNTFLVTDACGATVTIICRDTLPDISIEKSCNSITAQMRSNYVCGNGELNPYDIQSGVWYELALANQPGVVIDANNTGLFTNLVTGESYVVTATHGVCGVATAGVTLFTNGDFTLKAELRTTSFLQNGICQTGYQVLASLTPAPVLTAVYELTGSTVYTDTLGIFPGITPGIWTLSSQNYCVSKALVLPEWKPEMSVQMPECPNGGCVQMSGARTPTEWIAWGGGYGLDIISNSDFYILDCPGFNGPQCVANWGGNICNLIPGNSYSVYLKPGTFTCPVDTISFSVDPTGTVRIDSLILTTPVACTDTSFTGILVTVLGGKEPLLLEVIDSISGQVLRTFYDSDNDHLIAVDSLKALKTYFFRVVDACNNTKDISATVILLPGVTADYTQNCQGLITLKTAAIYNATYTWKTAGGTVIASGPNLWAVDINALPISANYSVEINFGNCLSHLTDVTVPGFVPAVVTLPFSDTLFCNGFSLQLMATTGSGTYTFLWNTGNTGDAVNINIPGIYEVIATDSYGCSDTAAANIVYSPAMTLAVAATDADCYGASTGTAAITIAGGTPAFDFLWENGSTTSGRAGLLAGQYTVTVTDGTGCTQAQQLTIAEPTPVVLSLTKMPVSCFGGANGSAQVTASGGTPGYSFLWNNGIPGNNISGVIAGTYTVTATDGNGCQAISSITVNQPPVLLVNAVVENIHCFGASTGSITAIATGGTGALGYTWSVPGGNNGLLQNLPAGDYQLIVTDQNNCTISNTLTLTQPALLTVTVAGQNIRCSGGTDGSITATAMGGTPPLTLFTWNTGATGPSIAGLSAGNYTVTVTDGNGCTATATTALSQPPPLTATATATPTSCHDSTDGTATAAALGGTLPYQYLWNTGAFTTPAVQSLPPGSYTVTVTDSHQCTVTVTAMVVAPPPLVATYTVAPVRCFGASNGAINTMIAGGTPVYVLNWSNTATTPDLQNLLTGTYILTVTDQHNCTTQISVPVPQPQPLAITSINTTGAGCGGNNGTAIASVSGGTAPFSAAWSDGQTGLAIQGLSTGTYAVTITDTSGCTTVSSASVTGVEPLQVEVSAQQVSCFGESDGVVTVESVTGGIGPPYFINGVIANFSSSINNLSAGIYTWTVSDGGTCSKDITLTITEPPLFSFSLPDIIQIGIGDQILLEPQLNGFPTPPITWQWTPSISLSCDSCAATLAMPFKTIQYQLQGVDANGCTAADIVRVLVNRNCNVYVANIFTPLLGGTNDLLIINAEPCVKQVLRWQIYDRWGGMVFSQKAFLPNDFQHAWDGSSRNKQVEAGVYVWQATYQLIDGTEVFVVGDVMVGY